MVVGWSIILTLTPLKVNNFVFLSDHEEDTLDNIYERPGTLVSVLFV
jgi:hypothetical protein